MAFRQYTKCYVHTPGDKPFNKDDLLAFVAGASAPGIVIAVLAFLSGMTFIGFVTIAVQYAATIIAVANQWLFHRLVCVSGDQCAVGTVEPLEKASTLGEFDNDDYFDMRLMPHRHVDEYDAPNTGFFAPAPAGLPLGTAPWTTNAPPTPGHTLAGATAATKFNDIFLDNFQGKTLVAPSIMDLPYKPVGVNEVPLFGFKGSPDTKVTRCTLHCEAEGNFWQAMKDYAAIQGAGVGGGAAAGAAAGCAIGGWFGPIGCLIGAIIGAIAGAAAAAYAGANAAFNSDKGNVDDANVGDDPLGGVKENDQVVVFGSHVYDGFHEGWHEFHPLKAIIKVTDPKLRGVTPYLEWDPMFPDGATPPDGLTVKDMRDGMDSPAFAAAAKKIKDQWCGAISQAFNPGVRTNQSQPQHRWTIHPSIDGCTPPGPAAPR
jgi:hypothetical protein